MSKLVENRVVLALVVLLVGLCGYGLHVRADGAPTSQPLWYAGSVTDATGTPLTGDHSVSLGLFTQVSGSTALCTTGPTSVAFEAGRFRLELATSCVQVLRSQPDLFVEVSVDDESTPFPRSKIGAVPYALEAQHAVTASEAVGALKQALDNTAKLTAWADFAPEVFVGDTRLTLAAGAAIGRYRRVGDTVEAQYRFDVGAVAGASGVVSFGLPVGLSPDIDKLVDYAVVGSANLYASSTPGGSSHWVGASEVNHNTSRIQVVFDSTGGLSAVLSDGFPFNLGTGGVTHFNVSIPVRGWTLSTP